MAQTSETSARTAALVGAQEVEHAARSATSAEQSPHFPVEEVADDRRASEEPDFDHLFSMVIGARDSNRQTAEFVRQVARANQRALANRRLTEDDLRVMDDATRKSRTEPTRGLGSTRLSAVAIERGQLGQGGLSYLYRPAQAESGESARSVLDSDLHGGSRRAGSGARPDTRDWRPSPRTTKVQSLQGDAVRAGLDQLGDYRHHSSAGREPTVSAMTPEFISGKHAKSALKPADVRGAALPSPKTATSVARPGGVPSVPIGAAGAGTPGESSQGSGLNPHDRQELPRLSKSGRQTEAKKTLPRAIRQKTLHDVQRVVRAALGRDRSVVRLKLSPPELGRLTIDMRMENDRLHLKFEPDSPRVRALLLSSSGLLSNSLAEAGVVVERYEVLLSADASDRAGFEAGLTEHDAPDDSPQDASDGSSARLNGAEAISPEDTLADELGDEQRTGLKAGLDVKA